MRFVQEIPLLKLFIKNFQKELLPSFAVLKDNEVDIGAILGPKFNKLEIIPPDHRDALVKQFGIELPNPLTLREQEVMKELLYGYSASQIGDTLFLSKRTVEHHLERIKDKLNVISKSDLIQKAQLLDSLGYLN
jgi:DNA-binding CsgD family transcriptional regulator